MKDYIIITFSTGKEDEVDLKVPVFVKVHELITMLSEGLGIPAGPESRLQAEPLGRLLDNKLTLEQEGVAHGALLTLI